MFPSRTQCANHGPATGEREPPERAHTGRAHPDDAESRPNMAETRKREKHTPRPPEQRRGSPNRQEYEPQRTAEESNLTHNHVSEPISSRTQQPCWITVQKRGNKHGEQEQRAKTRNKTRAPTATRKRTPQRHQPQGYTPNVGHNTRTRALVLNRFASPSTSRETRTRTPNRAPAFEAGVSTIPPHWQKKKGSGNKHERQPRDHNAPNQRDTRTPAAPSASPTRVRGHSQPAHPDRPQLTHQHREHPGANTQAPPAHTQRTTNAATHPCVTAPAAASTPALSPLPGRRSRT